MQQAVVLAVEVQVADRVAAERPVPRGDEPDGDQREGAERYAGSAILKRAKSATATNGKNHTR